MRIHANARTCPNSRKLLIGRIEEENCSPRSAAEAAGERSARKWLARRRSEGEAGLLDRYNYRRKHGSLGHRPPADRLNELLGNNLLGNYS